MKILVVGGTGMVGARLARRLIADGMTVRVFSRHVPRDSKASYEHVSGDVRDQKALQEAMGGVDAVVHLIAIIREKADQTFHNVNVQGTENAVRAAREAGVRRFVAMSVLGAQDSPRYPYLRSRWRGEQAVLSSGLEYTILRSSLLFGGPGGILLRVVQSLRLTPPPFAVLPGSGHTRFQPLWVEDLARCILQALSAPQHVRRLYEIGGPDYLTLRDITRLVLRARGGRRLFISVPIPLMAPAVKAMSILFRDPPVTLEELRQLALDNVADLDSIQHNFGFTPEPLHRHLDDVKGM